MAVYEKRTDGMFPSGRACRSGGSRVDSKAARSVCGHRSHFPSDILVKQPGHEDTIISTIMLSEPTHS